MNKTKVAQAVGSNGEQLAESSHLSLNLPEYSALDDFALSEEKQATQGELAEQNNNEKEQIESFEMTEDNAVFFAAMAVDKLELVAKIYLDADVELADEQREELAKKGAAVVQKWMPDGKLPPWLAKWAVEIEFGIALGAAGFSLYKQKQKFDKKQKQQDKASKSNILQPEFSHNIGG